MDGYTVVPPSSPSNTFQDTLGCLKLQDSTKPHIIFFICPAALSHTIIPILSFHVLRHVPPPLYYYSCTLKSSLNTVIASWTQALWQLSWECKQHGYTRQRDELHPAWPKINKLWEYVILIRTAGNLKCIISGIFHLTFSDHDWSQIIEIVDEGEVLYIKLILFPQRGMFTGSKKKTFDALKISSIIYEHMLKHVLPLIFLQNVVCCIF